MVTGPEKILHHVWEGEIYDALEKVIHEVLALDSIGATADSQLGNDGVDFGFALWASNFKAFF